MIKSIIEKNGKKWISSEDFATLPDIKVFVLKLETPKETLYFKSYNNDVLMSKIKSAIALYSENNIDFEIKRFDCKDTDIYIDNDSILDSIHSFKGVAV